MQPNPFRYGSAASPVRFIGRNKELRRVIGRLMNGESTAIIGDPRIGKTSLLSYLIHQDTRKDLYADKADQWHFSYIDSKMLGIQFTPAQLWEEALSPVKDQIKKEEPLYEHYKVCRKNQFGNFTLEKLFCQLRKANQRFILALDEFDTLLHRPLLNTAEFYGGLRALASRSEGAFALLISSRSPSSHLNTVTQEFNPTGSPFFNIFAEITIGSFSDNDVNELLSLSKDRFTEEDKHTIRTLAGHHPYLLHAAAAAMWDAYEIERLDSLEDRQFYVAKRLYRELDFFFRESWNNWRPEVCKAFTTVAVAHQAHLLNKKGFFNKAFLKGITEWKPELDELEQKGLILPNSDYEGGYCLNSQIMLTWLTDELAKIGRDDRPFEHWLQDKGIDGSFLSVSEKKVFAKFIRDSAKAMVQPATTIIAEIVKSMAQTP